MSERTVCIPDPGNKNKKRDYHVDVNCPGSGGPPLLRKLESEAKDMGHKPCPICAK